ncbi:MAG TPA: hypothetical protein VF745_00870 [Steroidobacteraceae bacterium]
MRCAHYAGFGALSRTAGSWIREVTHSYGAGLYFLGVLGLVAAALMPLVVTARFGGKGGAPPRHSGTRQCNWRGVP